jgi:hypothetical protein
MRTPVRDLMNMLREHGLEAVRQYNRPGRVCIDARAPNGVETMFSVSMASAMDVRNDLDTKNMIRKFARQNPAPETTTMKKATLAAVPAEAVTEAARELTPTEFYRLCEWTKTANVRDLPNLETLAGIASRHSTMTISESVMREAMGAVGMPEPDHWHAPGDPQLVVAWELGALMKQLGVEASPAFKKLLESIG